MTKKEEVFQYCEAKEGLFTLAEVYQGLANLGHSTIRWYLQLARDAGIITFVDNKGLYKKD